MYKRIDSALIGNRKDIKIMGIINVSPESFYKESVKITSLEIEETASKMENAGAHIIDIGAMSTAPYLNTMISEQEEKRRINLAIKAVHNSCSLPISIDTPRASTVKEALPYGIDAVNDITGLKYDKEMASIIADERLSVIVGAKTNYATRGDTESTVRALKESINIAIENGIDKNKIIVDPSIGFFRQDGLNPFFSQITDVSWYARDLEIMSKLKELKRLNRPICVSISRKSFIGKLFNLNPEERLIPSIVSEVVCVLNGANIIRTHNVVETVQAITMLSLLN